MNGRGQSEDGAADPWMRTWQRPWTAPRKSWGQHDPLLQEKLCDPPLRPFAFGNWSPDSAKVTGENDSSATNSATGNRNKSGVIDERGEVRWYQFS